MKPICTLTALLAAGCCASAWAALGGDAASVESDRAHMRGELRVIPTVAYTVHEITSTGLVMREYAAPDGRVFALAWQGQGVPDFHDVLGAYYPGFAKATAAPGRSHHQLAIETPELVVQSVGRTRAYSGRAWAPQLLPPGFSVADIR